MSKSPRFPVTASALALVAAFAATPMVQAQEHARDGREHREHRDREPRLSLQAEAVSEITQDKVDITLSAQLEGAEQADVSQRLTKIANDGLAQLRGKAGKEVTVRSGAYRIWPNTDRDGKITGWRGQADIVIESTDVPAASALAAQAPQGMAISDVAFSLSREARAAEEKRLLGEAAQAFRARADEAAKAFGFGTYSIRKLDLAGSGAVYGQPKMAMMRASAGMQEDAAPPQFEAGTAMVTVSVQGEVTLGAPAKP